MKVYIPVSTDVSVTAEGVERHCAEAGWIVSNVAPVPQGEVVCIDGKSYRNGDPQYAVEFWSAEVVATELDGEYEDAPVIELPFELKYSPETLEAEAFFRRMFEKREKGGDK